MGERDEDVPPEKKAEYEELEASEQRGQTKEERLDYFERRARKLDGVEEFDLDDSIRIRINSHIKELWEEAAENSGYSSVSELIRIAVEKEVSGRYEQQEEQLEQVLSAILDVHSEVEKTRTEIVRTREESMNEEKMETVLETALDTVTGGEN